MKCHLPTRKIGDPLYTTFQKIFTIIRIFLKSEAPKAPGLFTFVHRGGLEKRHWRTRSIFPSLPRIFLHLAVYSGTVAISTEKYTEGLHPERPARGAVLYTGQSRPCIEHKGPPSTKNMHTKDGHDSRGRNYKLRRSSPRSRGPPSQSESYVWDKALICRRPGESNSSI